MTASTEPTAPEQRPERRPPPTPIFEAITPWMTAMAAGFRVGLAGLTRVRVEGAIDEIPREGPVIIASNHASNLDVPVLGSSLMPRTGRRLQWLGKRELFAWPIVGAVAARGGVHPVDRLHRRCRGVSPRQAHPR